jgi:crossover junction endodeoxyribonuclease RuvC
MSLAERVVVLGLDVSLSKTGYALFDGSGFLRYGDIPFAEKKPRGMSDLEFRARRLSTLADEISSLFDGVNLCAIEGYAYGIRNSRAITGLAELGGVLRERLFRLGVPTTEIPPSELKKWATGKGNAKKDDMIRAVKDRFGIQVESSDTADAMLLSVYAYDTLVKE